MSGNPVAPGNLVKGAIVAIASDGSKRSLAFQYNPDTMQRTLQPNTVGGQPGSRSRAVRFAGAPTETITLDCRFSAVDAIDAGDVGQGIAPQLAALALLLYPKSADVIQAQSMLDDGLIEVVPALADRLLFVWGSDRVLPVELTSATIVEELYDAQLVPVLATVTLTLRALSYSDVDEANGSYAAFLSYQQGLEGLAQGAFTTGGSAVSTSRYANCTPLARYDASGRLVRYLAPRILPLGADAAGGGRTQVQPGERHRLDLVANRALKAPQQSWRIADANDAMDPFELCERAGTILELPGTAL